MSLEHLASKIPDAHHTKKNKASKQDEAQVYIFAYTSYPKDSCYNWTPTSYLHLLGMFFHAKRIQQAM